jgi:hypothetical protein
MHEVLAPWNVPPFALHCDSVVITHTPLGTQHAPSTGGGHSVVEHGVLGWKVPPDAAHCACVVWIQPNVPAVARQQAPLSGGGLHVVLAQLVPAPCHDPPMAAHCD